MMKRLFLLPLICFPIVIFAQGFGSFFHDQPFLAKDNTFIEPPTCNQAEWNPGTNSYTYAMYDFNCLGQSAGTPITTMSDFGQNAFTLTPRYTTNYPYCTNNVSEINNRRYGYFDGINDNLRNDSTSPEWPGPTTVFLVASTLAPTNTSGEVVFDNGLNSVTPGGMDQLLFTHSTGEYLATFAGQIGPFTINTNVWSVVECVFNGASSYVKTNGVTAISGVLNTTTRRVGVTLGGSRGQMADIQCAHVKIAWFACYTNTLDSTTTSNIFYYLTNRFNIH